MKKGTPQEQVVEGRWQSPYHQVIGGLASPRPGFTHPSAYTILVLCPRRLEVLLPGRKGELLGR
jgi:hypothetical protein